MRFTIIALVLCLSVCAQQSNNALASAVPFAQVGTVFTWPDMPFSPGQTFTVPPGLVSVNFALTGQLSSAYWIFASYGLPTLGGGVFCGASVDIDLNQFGGPLLVAYGATSPATCGTFVPCYAIGAVLSPGNPINVTFQAVFATDPGVVPCGWALSQAWHVVR